MAPPTTPPEIRFLAKVSCEPLGCWMWNSTRDISGYGQFFVGRGRQAKAHRWAYERWVGPIPDGLVLDHLCRNRICVNPLHLEVVTVAENNRRASHPKKSWTHCIHGHEFDEANTHYEKDGTRSCRACNRERNARRLQVPAIRDAQNARRRARRARRAVA